MNLNNNDGFDDFMRNEEMIELCTIGGEKSLEKIKKIVRDDPRRYIMETDNPNHIINQKDSKGLFPMYCASKHGNTLIVEYLISIEALPKQKF